MSIQRRILSLAGRHMARQFIQPRIFYSTIAVDSKTVDSKVMYLDDPWLDRSKFAKDKFNNTIKQKLETIVFHHQHKNKSHEEILTSWKALIIENEELFHVHVIPQLISLTSKLDSIEAMRMLWTAFHTDKIGRPLPRNTKHMFHFIHHLHRQRNRSQNLSIEEKNIYNVEMKRMIMEYQDILNIDIYNSFLSLFKMDKEFASFLKDLMLKTDIKESDSISVYESRVFQAIQGKNRHTFNDIARIILSMQLPEGEFHEDSYYAKRRQITKPGNKSYRQVHNLDIQLFPKETRRITPSIKMLKMILSYLAESTSPSPAWTAIRQVIEMMKSLAKEMVEDNEAYYGIPDDMLQMHPLVFNYNLKVMLMRLYAKHGKLGGIKRMMKIMIYWNYEVSPALQDRHSKIQMISSTDSWKSVFQCYMKKCEIRNMYVIMDAEYILHIYELMMRNISSPTRTFPNIIIQSIILASAVTNGTQGLIQFLNTLNEKTAEQINQSVVVRLIECFSLNQNVSAVIALYESVVPSQGRSTDMLRLKSEEDANVIADIKQSKAFDNIKFDDLILCAVFQAFYVCLDVEYAPRIIIDMKNLNMEPSETLYNIMIELFVSTKSTLQMVQTLQEMDEHKKLSGLKRNIAIKVAEELNHNYHMRGSNELYCFGNLVTTERQIIRKLHQSRKLSELYMSKEEVHAFRDVVKATKILA